MIRSLTQQLKLYFENHCVDITPAGPEVSRSIYLGNTQKQVELILERDGLSIPVTYYPVKNAPVVQLLNNEANRARFRK